VGHPVGLKFGMNNKNEFPVLMRILGALGELEGPGIIGKTLAALAVIMFLAILFFQGYVGWAVLLLLIFLFLVYFPRRKRQFQNMKKNFGITTDAPYGLKQLTDLILGFNENSDIILGIQDHTFVKINGSLFPLIFGSVSYGQIQTEGASSDTKSAIFVLAQGSDFSGLELKYQDVFELGGRQEDVSVYWVKDLKKLAAALTLVKESKSS
jgi:hypothetical protein